MSNCFSEKLSNDTLLFICRDMSALLSSGMSINALKNVSKGFPSDFSSVLLEISDKVSKGTLFSKALNSYPEYFSEQFTNFIELGELSG